MFHQRSQLSPFVYLVSLLVSVALFATACGSSTESADADAAAGAGTSSDVCNASTAHEAIVTSEDASTSDLSGTALTLATYDSFVVSEGTLEAFTAETGITVTQIGVGDTGQLISSAILTKDNPTADVLFGVDNTFLCRALDADIFVPYRSSKMAAINPALDLDPTGRVTPVDYGDVCVNYWKDAVPRTPTSLNDLTDPDFADTFVTQDPETSSPGFAFLLATIAEFGEDGWEEYWEKLAANNVAVASGWTDAYYTQFTAGGGDRSIVTSYASSPPADVIFSDPPVAEPRTAVIAESCFRQVEFAGILAGTAQPDAAAALIDFLLTPTFQEDIPGNMFVYPSRLDAQLPQAFVDFTAKVTNPLTIAPADIEANRDRWTKRWREIVLR